MNDSLESDRLEGFPHPRNNTGLIGHQAAGKAFLDAFASGKMPHAWLLTGPKGVGKATLAYRFARFLLAREGPSADGLAGGDMFGPPDSLDIDPDHPAVRRVAASSHPDLITLKREPDKDGKRLVGVIRVEDVRRLMPFFGMTSGEGGWRVVIVDTADDMNSNAANAILKILEEPPERAVLILLSHAPGGLLPTIRSRCRQLRLSPLKDEEVASLLAQHCPELEEGERMALARLGEGSPGRALALASHGGLDLYRELIALMSGLPKVDIEKLHQLGDKVAAKDAEGTYHTLTDLFGWWLARLVRNAATDFSLPEVVPGELDLMRRLTALRGAERWIELWEKGNHLVERADSVNLDRKQIILNLFLGLTGTVRA